MQNKHSIGSIPIILIFSHLYPVLEYNFFKQNYCAFSQMPFIFPLSLSFPRQSFLVSCLSV